MMQHLRHRSLALRALWVSLLLLALVWQPALMAASAVHESEHLIQTGHTLDAEHGDHGIPADETAAPNGSEAWHALMHMGHCCGHPSAMLPDSLQLAFVPDTVSPPPGIAAGIASIPLPQPLRPPIAG